MKKYQYSKTEFEFIENTSVPMAVYQFIDKRVVTVALSKGFMDLFGFEDREEAYNVMDNDMYRDCHPDDIVRVSDIAYRFATEGGQYEAVYRNKSPENTEYHIIHARGEHEYKEDGTRLAVIWYTDEGIYAKDGTGYTTILNKSFGDNLHRESLLYENNYDSLTGLPSMTYFFQLANAGKDRLIEEGKQPAMVYFDLNGMKSFNNKYGFKEGDRLLKAFTKVLIKHFSHENCSRFGQDHFVVYTDNDGLEDTLQEIFEEAKTINNGRTLPVRAGIFLKVIGEDEDAGIACDKAKAAADINRDFYESSYRYYDAEMQVRQDNKRYIIENFERALEENWIKVYYQPIVRAANGRVCDEEALSRWIDPVRGFMSPAEFIPVLEEAHLIYKLDLYVVRQILEKIRSFMDNGLFIVPQSVNLSRSDFEACDIVDEITRMADEAGVSHDKLTIEITESVIGSDFEFMKRQVERFHELGFSVWMDDFGSEYSSLDYLQSIPFDLIKLDMRFMKQFNDSEKTKIIITELVRLAINLGLEIVTEGVETEEQVNFLKEIGCTKLQGFYYCKPLPPSEVLERYKKGIQIGFENPEESGYYESLGRINLYDVSDIGRDESEKFRRYFDRAPMAIAECTGDDVRIARSNSTYRDLIKTCFGRTISDNGFDPLTDETVHVNEEVFLDTLRQCSRDGNNIVVDQELSDGSVMHTYLNRIAVNPVTGTAAVIIAVLAVTDKPQEDTGLSYTSVARALSGDYIDLFYVDIDTEEFIHFSSDQDTGNLTVVRQGTDFFRESRKDALAVLYIADQSTFIKTFTRENVLRAIDESGAFAISYRTMINGHPTYVSMKARYINDNYDHIIIGVSNVDSQMRYRAEYEKMLREQETYERISALSGNYIALYRVDPAMGEYLAYSTSEEYDALGYPKQGSDFLTDFRSTGINTVHKQDINMLLNELTVENIHNDICKNGMYDLPFRLIVDGAPRYVSLRIVEINEEDGHSLIAGIVDRDAFIRQDTEQARRLAVQKQLQQAESETDSEKDSESESADSVFQFLADHIGSPAAILSVDLLADGSCGDIRIIKANSSYKETMGGGYRDNMIYSELVPKDVKFEDFAYRAAHLGKRVHSYVETRALGGWTDLEMIPLSAGSSGNKGYCLFIFEFTSSIDADRIANVSAKTAPTIIKSCFKLIETDDFKSAAGSVLEDLRRISEAFEARIILVDRDSETVSNYCVAVDDRAKETGIGRNETLPYEIIRTWNELAETNNILIVKDEQDMRSLEESDPLWAEDLKSHNIYSVINVPLFHNNELFGYLYVSNFNVEKVVELKEILELLAFFLGAEVYNSLLLDRLELMLHTDALTGVNNRYAMLRRISEIEGSPFGVISIDLNGLKRCNDEFGHDAGDKFLIQAAEILEKVFYKKDLFRTGGDEFIVISKGIAREVFERKLVRLQRDAIKNSDVSFSIGAFWSDGSVNPSEALTIADNRMYAEKRKYYEANPELKIR